MIAKNWTYSLACEWEINTAIAPTKRLFLAVTHSTSRAALQRALAYLTAIFFNQTGVTNNTPNSTSDQAFAQLVGATDADTSGGSQDDVPYSFHERQPDSDAFSDATQPINTPSAVSRHAMGSPLVLSTRRIFVYAILIGLIIFPNSPLTRRSEFRCRPRRGITCSRSPSSLCARWLPGQGELWRAEVGNGG